MSKVYSFMEIIEMEAINIFELAEELEEDESELYRNLEEGNLNTKQLIKVHVYLKGNVWWYNPNSVYELIKGMHNAEKEVVDKILAK